MYKLFSYNIIYKYTNIARSHSHIYKYKSHVYNVSTRPLAASIRIVYKYSHHGRTCL